MQPLLILGLVCLRGVFALSTSPWANFGSLIAHDGTPVGEEVVYNGLTLYVSKPRRSADTAVVYLTDVFGINLTENKLLADSFARAGFFTVAPDLFDGQPAPEDLDAPGFNSTEFLAEHGPAATDPKIATAIEYATLQSVQHVAATGYCFGGRYTFRFLAEGKGVDVGFAAHPSLLQDDEILAITGAVSLAAAETDSVTPPERRHEFEALLQEAGQPYQVSLYSGTSHGFGVRANVSDPEQRFGKETAFLQAVRWFKTWA